MFLPPIGIVRLACTARLYQRRTGLRRSADGGAAAVGKWEHGGHSAPFAAGERRRSGGSQRSLAAVPSRRPPPWADRFPRTSQRARKCRISKFARTEYYSSWKRQGLPARSLQGARADRTRPMPRALRPPLPATAAAVGLRRRVRPETVRPPHRNVRRAHPTVHRPFRTVADTPRTDRLPKIYIAAAVRFLLRACARSASRDNANSLSNSPRHRRRDS